MTTTGTAFSVANGDRYLTTGRTDERGVALLVAESCPPDLRDEFAVPADGIELRHGPLTASDDDLDADSPVCRCDVCDEPITARRPGGRVVVSGIETWAHNDHAE